MAGRWLGPVLEPPLKPDHTLLYDLVYLSFYLVDAQQLGPCCSLQLVTARNSTRFQPGLIFWPPQPAIVCLLRELSRIDVGFEWGLYYMYPKTPWMMRVAGTGLDHLVSSCEMSEIITSDVIPRLARSD